MPELGNLTKLKNLWLGLNQLTELPAELGNLTALECLSLGRNQFSELPPELGSLERLKRLNVGSNELTGSLPPELGSLAALELLYLRHNQLTGSIPPELGNLTELVMLELYRNQLTGSLQRTFLQLQGLDVFWFSTNAGLCAPPDDEFQTWLSMIQNEDGPNCAPAVSVEQDGALPVQVAVKGNYPNLFRRSTHLRLDRRRGWESIATYGGLCARTLTKQTASLRNPASNA